MPTTVKIRLNSEQQRLLEETLRRLSSVVYGYYSQMSHLSAKERYGIPLALLIRATNTKDNEQILGKLFKEKNVRGKKRLIPVTKLCRSLPYNNFRTKQEKFIVERLYMLWEFCNNPYSLALHLGILSKSNTLHNKDPEAFTRILRRHIDAYFKIKFLPKNKILYKYHKKLQAKEQLCAEKIQKNYAKLRPNSKYRRGLSAKQIVKFIA